MKITHEQIVKLVKQHPNDELLGRAIRNLINNMNTNANEVYVDPAQVNLLDSINEVTNSGHGTRY